jgi:hypothetical protein
MARRLLAQEAEGQLRPDTVADALDRACQRLHTRLVPLVGHDGMEALFFGALSRAKIQFPFLGGIELAPAGTGCFRRLNEAVQDGPPAEAVEGVVQLLGNVFGLLAGLLGEDLALRLVRRVWPGIAWDQTDPGRQERGA